MALQGNNLPISFSDIQDEYGGTNPISLSEYYRGGSGLTTANNTGVPTSGSIDLSDFYSTKFAWEATYEIIGAGGAGGSGWTTSNNGTAGGNSTITYTDATTNTSNTVTSSGGAGGRGGIETSWSDGSSSYYGSGGAGGANSDSGNQSAGSDAPSTSYGAGGGGGGAAPFSGRNGGEGGYAGGLQLSQHAYTVTAWNSSSQITRYVGQPSTGTVFIEPSSTVSVVIGAGGTNVRPDPGTDGGFGADGYCKITVNGTDTEYTSDGSYTYTAPSN